MSLENKELVNNIESKIKYTKDNCKLFIELGILKELMRLNDSIEKGMNVEVKMHSEPDI
jgi:hypothetical protein